jgi:hypothetical protein
MDAFWGFIVGIPSSIVATWILGSILPIATGYHSIRFLASLRRIFRHDELFDVQWTQEWDVQTEQKPKSFPSNITLHRFTNLLAAEFKDADETGHGVYRIVAVVDGNKITGTWKDSKPMGYYGTFQLLVSHKRDEATGKWIGFSSQKQMVRVGSWVWKPIYELRHY